VSEATINPFDIRKRTTLLLKFQCLLHKNNLVVEIPVPVTWEKAISISNFQLQPE